MHRYIQNQRGAILIALIIAILMTASLGAGMVHLTASSSMNQALANQESKAYYLAEAGCRYAFSLLKANSAYFDAYSEASPYLNTLTLANNDQVQVKVYKYSKTATALCDNSKCVTIAATGKTKTGAWIESNRLVTWDIDKASVGSGGGTSTTVNLADMADSSKSPATGVFEMANVGGDQALMVRDTTSAAAQEAYVPIYYTTNPFYTVWNAAGGFISYDSQVKIAEGDWTGTAWGLMPPQYCVGMTTQHRRGASANQDTFYGVSIIRTNNETLSSPLWRWLLAFPNVEDNIPNSMIPTGVSNHVPMIMLWTRNGNQGGGDDRWLAYKEISTNDYILSNYSSWLGTWPSVTPWSTIVVRLVEAASIKLNDTSAPNVNVGATISDDTGKTAKVIKKIQDSDSNVVLLLNNVTTGFTRPTTVSGYSTDATWGYRTKDNYIWVFYGDPSAHGTANTDPRDNNRLANLRGGTSGVFAWPVTDLASWPANKDNFRVVQWNASLNTSADGDPNIRLMGKGNELDAIIRTNKWITTGIGSYTQATFPPMLGVVCIGDWCDGAIDWGWGDPTIVQAYYDDLSYLFPSGGTGTPSGVQY